MPWFCVAPPCASPCGGDKRGALLLKKKSARRRNTQRRPWRRQTKRERKRFTKKCRKKKETQKMGLEKKRRGWPARHGRRQGLAGRRSRGAVASSAEARNGARMRQGRERSSSTRTAHPSVRPPHRRRPARPPPPLSPYAPATNTFFVSLSLSLRVPSRCVCCRSTVHARVCACVSSSRCASVRSRTSTIPRLHQ